MRRYTDEKYEYDRLTAEWFRGRGYIAEIISGPGLADVVAYHPKTKRFAICEVKSPRERDAHWSFETEYNLKGMGRRQVLELIRAEPGYRKNPGLWRLYAFTVTSQLYTYYKCAGAHLGAAKKRSGGLQKVNFRKIRVVPYLAVPVENERVFKEVVKFFRQRKWLKSHRFYRAGQILVVIVIQY
ncbi:hypothetical protein ACFL43_01755 [Thermodesulfobacteriota bacterium]